MAVTRDASRNDDAGPQIGLGKSKYSTFAEKVLERWRAESEKDPDLSKAVPVKDVLGRVVIIDSNVAAFSLRPEQVNAGVSSPEYVATVRRRKTRNLANSVLMLSKNEHKSDFVVPAMRVLEEIHELIELLEDVRREGNTLEILSQIRDSFFDGGCEKYRKDEVRKLVAQILMVLSGADRITSSDAEASWEKLYAAGLGPVLPQVFTQAEKEGR